jgi:hypothetical protein
MQSLPSTILDDLVQQRILKKKVAAELKFTPDTVQDWALRDFFAITDRHRSKGVLIADLDRRFTVPFRLQMRKPSSRTGRVEAIVCDICTTWQRGSNSAMITFERGTNGSRSYLCCADLLCSLHVRNLTPQAKLSRAQLREQVTTEHRIERLRAKLNTILGDL